MSIPDTASPVRAVMFFVDDQLTAAQWYRDHVLAAGEITEDQGYVFIECGGMEIGFHPSDPVKNPQGASVVAYFASQRFTTLEATVTTLIASG